MNLQRPLLEQQFSNIVVALAAANIAQPIKPNGALTDMITSFVVSVPSTAANSVFLGDANVTTASGIEILPGAPLLFTVDQVRQLYELQAPLEDLVARLSCNPAFIQEKIPFVCWNLQNVYLVAAAATNIAVMPFKTPYI